MNGLSFWRRAPRLDRVRPIEYTNDEEDWWQSRAVRIRIRTFGQSVLAIAVSVVVVRVAWILGRILTGRPVEFRFTSWDVWSMLTSGAILVWAPYLTVMMLRKREAIVSKRLQDTMALLEAGDAMAVDANRHPRITTNAAATLTPTPTPDATATAPPPSTPATPG